MTSHLRPSFFIVGERKCGTSSLYRYLLEHPRVLPGTRKEMQFFTKGREHVEAHFDSYLQNFPDIEGQEPVNLDWPELDATGTLYEERIGFAREAGEHYITGEASADTLCDGDPTLLREYLPDLALIALLRDPAERAFSHHRMYRRFQDEGRPLPFVVGDFAADMREEMRRVGEGDLTPCLSPGLYMKNLAPWLDIWGARLLPLFSAELDDPAQFPDFMSRVVHHLGLPEHPYALAQRYNQAPSARMPEDIRQELRAFFAPHDQALAAHLGQSLPW